MYSNSFGIIVINNTSIQTLKKYIFQIIYHFIFFSKTLPILNQMSFVNDYTKQPFIKLINSIAYIIMLKRRTIIK